jgi:sugar lactone lactonase YvrE
MRNTDMKKRILSVTIFVIMLSLLPFGTVTAETITITTQPDNVTVASGGNASFSIAATGSALTYQWRVDTGSGGFTDVSDDEVYSGATTASLSITGVTAGMDYYQYHCMVTDDGAYSTASDSAALRVIQPPKNIVLDNASIAENTASGTRVGGLTTEDPDSSIFTYSLADTAAYPDNASFTISESDLILNTVPDYENKQSYSIRIRTQDNTGLFYDKTFTISVTETYTVTYYANEGTGTAPTENNKATGATFTAAAADSFIAPSGKQFKEWNTASDGTGTGYAAGGTVTMPAGNLNLYAVWEDITGTVLTTLDQPKGIAVDGSGNIYVADTGHNVIKRMNTDGGNVVILGSGFLQPEGVAVDGSGNIYVADTGHNVIKRMNADGSNVVILGSGFLQPEGIAVDGSGNIYVADTGHSTVKRMNPDGSNIVVLAWEGMFSCPKGIAVDDNGNVYIADTGNSIITIICGYGIFGYGGYLQPCGIAVDADGRIYVADAGNSAVEKMDADGSNRVAFGPRVSYPCGIAVDGSGNIYVADTGNNAIRKIQLHTVNYVPNGGAGEAPAVENRHEGEKFAATDNTFTAPSGRQFREWNTKADGTGTVYKAGGTVTMPADNLTLYAMWAFAVTYAPNGGIEADPLIEESKFAGEIFTAAEANSFYSPFGKQFREWNTKADGTGTGYAAGGTVTMPAGSLTLYAIWEEMPGISVSAFAGFGWPAGIVADGNGNIYITDPDAGEIKRMNSDGSNIVTLASGIWSESIAADASGNIYVTDLDAGEIRRMNSDGSNIVTLASGIWPGGIAVDGSGNIYVTDPDAGEVRKMNAGSSDFVILASGSHFYGIAVDGSGNICVTDPDAGEVRKMNAGSSDFVILASGFDCPAGIAVDANGKIYVTDIYIGEVKRMNSDGSNIVTLGSGFAYPAGITADARGNIYVTESARGTVTKVVQRTYTVTYDLAGGIRTGGGELIQNVAWCDTATAPTASRSGYTFTGWDKSFSQVTKNMIITALWSSYGTDGGSDQHAAPAVPPGSNIGTAEAPVYQADGSDEAWGTIGREIDSSGALAATIELGGATVVPASLLEAIAGRNITVTFDLGGGIAWRIQGSDLEALKEEGQGWKDLDLKAAIGNDIPSATLEELARELGQEDPAELVQLSLSHEGSFGFALSLSVYLGKAKAGKTANLFYYNPATQKLEFQYAAVINAEGYAEFPFTHASDYAIALDDGKVLRAELDKLTLASAKTTLYTGGNTGREVQLELNLPVSLQSLSREDSLYPVITYASSNPKVALVTTEGRIKALKAGQATITVTVTVGGAAKTVTAVITVKKAYIKLIEKKTSLKKGESYTYSAVGYGITSDKIIWSTTKKSVVVIDKRTGRAVARSAGTDVVVAKYNSIQETVKVTVK